MTLRSALTWSVLCTLAAVLFLYPGVCVLRDLADPALSGPGTPRRAITLHQDLTPRLERWARDRVASGHAAAAPLHDVPMTEWPMFTSVFYLLGTEELQAAWRRGELHGEPEPMSYARAAVDAARDLAVDPVHHTWVRTHWGEDYLHRQNVFFRALLVSALTSHLALTGDRADEPLLRDQVESLAAALDASPLGLLDDYPGECYPIDVLVAVAWIRRADAVLGTDHSAFASRALRAFTGPQADPLGLVRYRVLLLRDATEARDVQPARGVGMSWVLLFAPDLWPDASSEWYRRYEASYWQDRGWAAGFREWAPGTEADNGFEIDAGFVVGGLGTAASAFGIAAARRHGRFDHAFPLAAEMSAASWTLPDGTLLWPRAFSHAAAAPYLGEAALQYFLSVQPAPGATIVPTGGAIPGLTLLGLAVYFGVPLSVVLGLGRALQRALARGASRRRAEAATKTTATSTAPAPMA